MQCSKAEISHSLDYLKTLFENGRPHDALRALESLQNQNVPIPIRVFFGILQSCIKIKDINISRRLKSLIKQSGFDSNAFLSSHLIRLFATCNSISDAVDTFESLPIHEHTVFTWNAIISAQAKLGNHEDALRLFHQMHYSFTPPDKHVFTAVLKSCRCMTALQRIHCQVVNCGFDIDVIVCNTVIAMYLRYGYIDEARLVFKTMRDKDAVTWNALISGYVHLDLGHKAINLFIEMQQTGLEPTAATFVCVLEACANDVAGCEGMLVHVLIMKQCLEQDVFVANSLIEMYAKRGSVQDVSKVFEMLHHRDVATWNAMIGAYAMLGLGKHSIELFQKMQEKCVKPDNITFLSILKACSSIVDLEQGIKIENHINRSGLDPDLRVASSLIDMYVKCGSLEHAKDVFDKFLKRDIVMWNTLISGYAQQGYHEEPFQLFQEMQNEKLHPDGVTAISLLRATIASGSTEIGKLIHSCILYFAIESEDFVESSLVDMYAKLGCMDDAKTLFDGMLKQDIVPWNVIIAGYVQQEETHKALGLFISMIQEGMDPDKVTFSSILTGCSDIAAIEEGKVLHAFLLEMEFEEDMLMVKLLIDMYKACNDMTNAKEVFCKARNRDLPTWNSFISSYVQCHQNHDALQAFYTMHKKGIQPNELTIISVLQASSSLEYIETINAAYHLVIESGYEFDIYVMSTLMDTYAKCGHMKAALHTFYGLKNPGIVTWTVMISAYVQHEDGEGALQLFYHMQKKGVEPNRPSFISVIKACILLSAVIEGKLIHDCILRKGLGSDEVLGSALIDMYAAFGSMNDALKVFSELPTRDIVAWNSVITCFSLSNDHKMALKQFQEMRQEGLETDIVTGISLLSACSHTGTIGDGFTIFESMQGSNDIIQSEGYLNCLVDLLGRVGELRKANDLLQSFPLLDNAIGWRSLLSHCQTHVNVELGQNCFDRLIRIGVADATSYRIMSNIYARAGMHQDAGNLRFDSLPEVL